jgi:hypothetical protein
MFQQLLHVLLNTLDPGMLSELALSTIWLGQPHNGMSNSLGRNDASYNASHNNECELNVHEQIIQMTTLGPLQAFFPAHVNGSITVE